VGRSLLQTTETVSNTLRIAASPSDSASQDGLVGYDVRLTRERSPVEHQHISRGARQTLSASSL